MPDNTVSRDEYLSQRKRFVKSGDILVKAFKAPPSWDPQTRSARFVMSSEAPDRDKDIIVQAGLDIAEFLKNPVGLLFHMSRSWPIGLWSDVAKVNGRPKRTEGSLTLIEEGKDPLADQTAVHIGAGTLRACSIGFIPKLIKRREREQDADEYVWPGYEIIESELVECSVVPIPAQPAALVKSAGGDQVLAREIIESVLDNWVRLPCGITVPREDYEAALKTLTGEKTTSVGAITVDLEVAGRDRLLDAADQIKIQVDGIVGQAAADAVEKVLADDKPDGLLTKFKRALGLLKAPEQLPPPTPPVPATAEQKQTALAAATAAEETAQRLLAA